ncbi:prefoldin subunit [Candidatus Pacearchaeota archaeon]|nr:prefoldin subunit [Candidatus Pacearchaeota archaeon]
MPTKQIDEETGRQIQELQLLEQNLQNFLLQKQAFVFEKNETENALEEIKKTDEDVYKIIGQVMLKSKKAAVEKELQHKKDILELRVKAIERQEEQIKEQLIKKRDEVMKKLK